VALVRNQVSVNEEVDPHAIIRKLRLEVRRLPAAACLPAAAQPGPPAIL
jgi:hypothetical protein